MAIWATRGCSGDALGEGSWRFPIQHGWSPWRQVASGVAPPRTFRSTSMASSTQMQARLVYGGRTTNETVACFCLVANHTSDDRPGGRCSRITYAGEGRFSNAQLPSWRTSRGKSNMDTWGRREDCVRAQDGCCGSTIVQTWV